MDAIKILGVILIIAGLLVLVYRGFTYTSETHETQIGPLELKVKEKKKVHFPVWTGVVAILAGAGILAFRRK